MKNSFWRTLKQQFQSWFTQAQAIAESEDDLIELPDAVEAPLSQYLKTLPSAQAYQDSIQAAAAEAIEVWQQDLDAPNCLVVLGSPVEAIAKVLDDSLQDWPDRPLSLQVITPFAEMQRPREPLSIGQKIQQALQSYASIELNERDAETSEDSETEDGLEQRTVLVTIPSLESFFLRCIGGWQGIEQLRDIIIRNRHCFWVVGCNHWAWNFLDFVCQISAYFSEVYPLPALNGEDLQAWLDPMTTTVVSTKFETERSPASGSATASEDHPAAADDDRRRAYWDSLAKRSSGVSQIAVALWLQSLRVPQAAVADEQPLAVDLTSAEPVAEAESRPALHETKLALPNLPALTSEDRYLLHAILIHGAIAHAHLALSLGESEGRVQSQIQRLLREGILQKHAGRLSVQAAYYPKLKSELENNNFFVGDD